ncbi:hypothetical protein VTN77DRAFT_4571 [Rasamsonia byssochlamydoides]|uniref:uncharacterized protein n=1 Tax=Rasamsonia byssochlamydoides TaxID=89139 RepID=UPI0037420195
MDLRTIMNNDASGVANSSPSTSQQSPVRQQSSDPFNTPRQNEASTPGSSYQAGYFARPPQPPPLQPPHRSPGGSSTYSSAQSPYQYNSASTLSAGAQSQHAQSPSRAYPPVATPASPAVYNQPQGPSLASPYTPQSVNSAPHQQQQQSYFSHQGSQSLQDSPRATSAQQPFPPQQQFSPQNQRSQPGTPLGPPSVPYQRPPSQSARPPSSGREHGQLSASWGSQEIHGLEQRNTTPRPPSRRESRQADQTPGQYPGETDRERSVSVSPKTIVSRQSIAGSVDRGSTPYRNSMDEGRWKESPPGTASGHSHSGSVANSSTKHQTVTPQQSYPQPAQVAQANSSPLARHTPSRDTPASSSSQSRLQKSEAGEASESPAQPPKRKRRRYDEPPIYARKAPRTSGRSPVVPNRRPPIPKHAVAQFAQENRPVSQQRSLPSAAPLPSSARPAVNGDTLPNGRAPLPAPTQPSVGLLGPWEPSITGLIPHEEVTKVICDFLFQQVVIRRDLGAGPAGAAATGNTAILEVEAKLGQLIDRDKGGRLRLPVLTETIINKEAAGHRTAFESTMTLGQHRAMNNFLNEAVKASMPQPGSNRIPLSYAHKKERDTFYEISTNELPPIVQHNLHPRHKPRVRVTTDQRTGEVVSKIVKCRIADLDVYSPRTHVDWRISVNLEMNYDGDVRHLQIADSIGARGRSGGERNKDRMSYRHLAYQIDLTQVATTENPSKSDFEHELEVEVSAAEVRRQGDLALAGDPKNQYEDLIKGFIDNVRVLARAVPAQ